MASSDYPFWQNNTFESAPNPAPISNPAPVSVIAEDVIACASEIVDLKSVEQRLTKARTQLILDHPFLGNLVLRLPLLAADAWCKTSATDAKNFYYNPSFINELNAAQIKFVLIHEALHCALTHFARRGNRVKHKWDLACDFAINPLLVKEGFRPPLDLPIFHKYQGMIAEEIYPMIDDKLDVEPMDQHLYDDNPNSEQDKSNGGLREDNLKNNPSPAPNSPPNAPKNPAFSNPSQHPSNAQPLAKKPPPLSPDEVESLATQWQKNLASSAQIANQAGKLSADFMKLIDFFLQPRISWQALLAQYMTRLARDDFTYARPSRRFGDAILPSLRSAQINLCVAIDTSGSITQDEINEFIAEIAAIKSNIRASLSLIACDETLNPACPWRFEAWEELQFPATLGGGRGTNFKPVFEYLQAQDIPSDALIYFTDGRGIFPEFEPNYPVLWLVKGKEGVPWGVRIQLN